MIKLKIDVVQALKDNGYTTTKMRNEKLIGENALTSLRQGTISSIDTLNRICAMLRCQPQDIIEFVATDEEKIKYF